MNALYTFNLSGVCTRQVKTVLTHHFFSLQAHNDLIRTYEAKLHSFGVPTEELGFKPLQSNVTGQQLGKGAAGLVVQPT